MCLRPVTITHTRFGVNSVFNSTFYNVDGWNIVSKSQRSIGFGQRKDSYTVPCGKCEECVKDIQNEYVIRTVEEQRKRGTVCFLTLTYNEGSVPRFTSDMEVDEDTGEILSDEFQFRGLRRKDLVDWKKRVCQQYYRDTGKRLSFSYLLCGEYGPKTHRPHYHGLLLGLTKFEAQYFINDWTKNFGFVCAKWVPSLKADVVKVARYCSKYICKLKEWDTMPSPDAERPRKMTSVGYGMPDEQRWEKWKRYYTARDYNYHGDVDALAEEIVKRRKYKLQDNEYKLPNYYKRKLFYQKDAAGKMRASSLQRLVTDFIQLRAEQDFKREVFELATGESEREIAEAIDRYNMIHEDQLHDRKEAIRKVNKKYMAKAIYS